MKGRFSPQAPDDAQLRDPSLKSLDTANKFAKVQNRRVLLGYHCEFILRKLK